MMRKPRACLISVFLVALVALSPGSVLGYEPVHDFDLRWDGSSLVGGSLLNPADLAVCADSTLTVSAQSSGDDRIWELQYVKREDNGLTGGVVIGGLENTMAYGVAGNFGRHLGAGLSVSRSGRGEDQHEYGATVGLVAHGAGFYLGGAHLIPIGDQGEEQTEFTAGWEHRVAGISVGYRVGETDPNRWAGIRLGPVVGVTAAYVVDLPEDGSDGTRTTSLKLGVHNYLIATRKAGLATDEYSLGLGVTF